MDLEDDDRSSSNGAPGPPEGDGECLESSTRNNMETILKVLDHVDPLAQWAKASKQNEEQQAMFLAQLKEKDGMIAHLKVQVRVLMKDKITLVEEVKVLRAQCRGPEIQVEEPNHQHQDTMSDLIIGEVLNDLRKSNWQLPDDSRTRRRERRSKRKQQLPIEQE